MQSAMAPVIDNDDKYLTLVKIILFGKEFMK